MDTRKVAHVPKDCASNRKAILFAYKATAKNVYKAFGEYGVSHAVCPVDLCTWTLEFPKAALPPPCRSFLPGATALSHITPVLSKDTLPVHPPSTSCAFALFCVTACQRLPSPPCVRRSQIL